MRKHLLDLLERLVAVHNNLGPQAFERACHGARQAIARSVLEEAEIGSRKASGRLNREHIPLADE